MQALIIYLLIFSGLLEASVPNKEVAIKIEIND
jgi:hypothetical protein